MDLDHAEDGISSIFQEPEGYFQPEKPPTFAEHKLLSGEVLRLRLVGHNPLWGHYLWNAGQVVSEYLQNHVDELVKGKDILELGAGAGLPSLVCAHLGARKVVATDYPDQDLVDNLQHNVDNCQPGRSFKATITVEGYLWGAAPLSPTLSSGFDLLILADLLFNHSEHGKLVRTIAMTLRRKAGARALVFFTPYRPWLLERDVAFFELVRGEGFAVEKRVERIMDRVMFVEDRGDERLRRTVFGYEVRWA